MRNSQNRWKSRGAITIFEMFPVIALVCGIYAGIKIGSQFGHFGAWIGGTSGGLLGLLGWRFLFMALCKRVDRTSNLRHRTTEELREMLYNPRCKNPNEVLLELGVKGEKLENYLPVVLELMVSPLMETRQRGWFTLVTVFPERAKLISDYQFIDSVENCRTKVQKLASVHI